MCAQPLLRFQYFCVRVVSANGLQLRLPGDTNCFEFDGMAFSKQNCRVTFLQQRWAFESSTMKFRHHTHFSLCLDFQDELQDFQAIECSPEADRRQKFHFSIGTDGRKYCIGKDEGKCVQEATLGTSAVPTFPACSLVDYS